MRGTIGQYAVQRCLEQCVGPNLGHVARVDRQCTGNWYDCAPITVGRVAVVVGVASIVAMPHLKGMTIVVLQQDGEESSIAVWRNTERWWCW